MSDQHNGHQRDPGPHLHAHSAPTTGQMRTVGQRRRDAEEKLEHHLAEARHKNEHNEDEHHEPSGQEAGQTQD